MTVNPYSTHQTMLRKVLEATAGPVLELGVGESSTPLLHDLCVKQGRKVVSYDTDTVFFEMYRDLYAGPLHEFHYIRDDEWDHADIEKPWSVVLVDHRPARRRQVEATRVAPHAEYVVCHDTEPENDRFYRWGKAYKAFKYRFFYTEEHPHTAVLSNKQDTAWLGTKERKGDSKDRSLTLVHYTSNRLDAANPLFAQIIRDHIMGCALFGGYPLVTVSQQPMEFGHNVCIGVQPRSHLNLYRAVLTGAKAAKTTFVALVEDDVLYPASHFTTRRPPLHKFSYDVNGWGMNTWVRPAAFGYRNRKVINRLIAPRELLIEALEERFRKYAKVPENQIPVQYWGDLGRYEDILHVTVRETETYAAPDPSVVFSHQEAFGFLSRGKRKSVGECLRSSLPYWGEADAILNLWLEGYKGDAD